MGGFFYEKSCHSGGIFSQTIKVLPRSASLVLMMRSGASKKMFTA
jgi:hypothetical protein